MSTWSAIPLWQWIALVALGLGIWQWRRPRLLPLSPADRAHRLHGCDFAWAESVAPQFSICKHQTPKCCNIVIIYMITKTGYLKIFLGFSANLLDKIWRFGENSLDLHIEL